MSVTWINIYIKVIFIIPFHEFKHCPLWYKHRFSAKWFTQKLILVIFLWNICPPCYRYIFNFGICKTSCFFLGITFTDNFQFSFDYFFRCSILFTDNCLRSSSWPSSSTSSSFHTCFARWYPLFLLGFAKIISEILTVLRFICIVWISLL